METIERWLSVDEIASHLGVSAVTIYRWLEKGRIPAHRIGKLWKFKASEVDLWIKGNGKTSLRSQKNSVYMPHDREEVIDE